MFRLGFFRHRLKNLNLPDTVWQIQTAAAAINAAVRKKLSLERAME
jgi:hypothetical protein